MHGKYEESEKPTQYAVICPLHGRVYLTESAYWIQLGQIDDLWRCPRFVSESDLVGFCGAASNFDDSTYEGVS